jgi:hypothetical protein
MTTINSPHEQTFCESINGVPAAAFGGAELAAVEDAGGGERGGESEPTSEEPRPVELHQLLSMELPPRRWLLQGLLQEHDLAMVHAYRGIGKSRFVHSVAVAVAAGGSFLRYFAPETLGILPVDGELPREDLQRYLTATAAAWLGCVRPRTLDNWRSQSRGPRFVRRGRSQRESTRRFAGVDGCSDRGGLGMRSVNNAQCSQRSEPMAADGDLPARVSSKQLTYDRHGHLLPEIHHQAPARLDQLLFGRLSSSERAKEAS